MLFYSEWWGKSSLLRCWFNKDPKKGSGVTGRLGQIAGEWGLGAQSASTPTQGEYRGWGEMPRRQIKTTGDESFPSMKGGVAGEECLEILWTNQSALPWQLSSVWPGWRELAWGCALKSSKYTCRVEVSKLQLGLDAPFRLRLSWG